MEVFGYIDSRQNRISEKTYFTTYNIRNMFWATILYLVLILDGNSEIGALA